MTTRRTFLKTSLAAGAALTTTLSLTRSAHAAGADGFRVGLIGCGGRGSGAAANAMNAGEDVKLVAMADLFEDRLAPARARLKELNPNQVQVDDDHLFHGFDAYKKVLESDVDVVLIAPASHFIPAHLGAAIAAGKHVFCEKPHALDVPGIKAVTSICEEARQKGLAIVSGLCWRYDQAVCETMKRVQDGAIGEIIAVQENYVGGPYYAKDREPQWSELEYQFQNWYHFNWLSGDQTAQQLIHSIDKGSWALGDVPPVKAWGLGGRQVCLEPKYGDQFDHFSVVFEYASGVRMYAYCRDIPGCAFNETSDVILGTKGKAFMPDRCRIEGANPWRAEKSREVMYDSEHKALFDSIRKGQPINNSNYMILSSMLAILAQMVCYTGEQITWEQAMASTLDFSLPEYNWDAEPPVKPNPDGTYPCPLPGVTKFV
ncbi:MAG: Gfo/Idh/MocA family oxidoreductase [Planctomycetaceae bacterium]|nr:Gfo/Idh/MocA family oxidoreductase [Planctomycetaceae bacterium]